MPASLRRIRKTFNALMTLPRRTVLSVRNSIRAFIQFLHLLSVRLREDRLIQVAGSLTFTMLLSLVPLLTIALTVFSAFPGFAGLWTAIRSFILTNLVPTMAGKVVGVYMQQFAENAGRLTALGLVMIAVTAVMMMHTIEGTFNTIWRVRRMRPLISRVLIFWGVMTIGPLLIGASLSLTSWLVTESMGLMGDLQRADLILLKLIPAVLTSSAFALLYRTVPNRRVETRDALLGGVFAGVLFEGMKAAFSEYVKQVPGYNLVYGAFASIPIFLTWIFMSWLIILIGAELTAALPYLRTGGVKVRRVPGSQFLEALRLLRLLYQAYMQGGVATTEQLRATSHLPWEECEGLLERMAKAGWVMSGVSDGWGLARDAAEIRLADVYQEFVFHPGAHAEPGDPTFEGRVAQLTMGVHDDLSITLKTLFTMPAQGRPRRMHVA
jgi:membrane protein